MKSEGAEIKNTNKSGCCDKFESKSNCQWHPVSLQCIKSQLQTDRNEGQWCQRPPEAAQHAIKPFWVRYIHQGYSDEYSDERWKSYDSCGNISGAGHAT